MISITPKIDSNHSFSGMLNSDLYIFKSLQMGVKENYFHNNIALAAIFHNMANCYTYLGKEDRFRAIAYENASKTIYNMEVGIDDLASNIKSLDALGTIGERIAEKIIEYLHTGKITAFEKLKKEVPYELLALMDISGFGVATLKKLHDELSINNKEELIKYIELGKLDKIKGFRKKKIEAIKRSLKLLKIEKRIPLKDAEKIANDFILKVVKIPKVELALVAGSIRRKKMSIGDIDIVIVASYKNRKSIVAQLIKLSPIKKVLAKGQTKVSALLKYKNVQIDIRLVQNHELGAAMVYATGSKEHNIKLRIRAKTKGYKMNEYGIFEIASNKRVAGNTEESIYDFLNLKYIPPERRVDNGEIEKAELKKNN
jgi:DNA polymerase (family X)